MTARGDELGALVLVRTHGRARADGDIHHRRDAEQRVLDLQIVTSNLQAWDDAGQAFALLLRLHGVGLHGLRFCRAVEQRLELVIVIFGTRRRRRWWRRLGGFGAFAIRRAARFRALTLRLLRRLILALVFGVGKHERCRRFFFRRELHQKRVTNATS